MTPFLLRLTRPRSTFPCRLDVRVTTVRLKADFFGHGTPLEIVNTSTQEIVDRFPRHPCHAVFLGPDQTPVQIGYRDYETRCGVCLAGLKGS